MNVPRIVLQPNYHIPKHIVDMFQAELVMSEALFPDIKWSGEPLELAMGMAGPHLAGVSRGVSREAEVIYRDESQELTLFLTSGCPAGQLLSEVTSLDKLDLYDALALCDSPADHPLGAGFEVHFKVGAQRNESDLAVNLLLRWFFVRETLPDVK